MILFIRHLGLGGLLALFLLTTNAVMPAGSHAQSDDAKTLLQQSATRMAALKSFGFKLTTVRGESTILSNLELKTVEGAVQRPTSFQATITTKLSIVEVKVDVIGIDTQVWVTNPLSSSGAFVALTSQDSDPGAADSAQSIADLLNPDRLLLQAVSLIKDPKLDGQESLDGVQTTRIAGTVNLGDLSQVTAVGTPAPGELPVGLALEGERAVRVWLDEAQTVVRVEFEGPLTTSESPDVIRRLELSAFDEPVQIIAPTNVEVMS